MDEELESNPEPILDWLDNGAWSARDAAYILVNLDPDWTEEPVGKQGWCWAWICRDPQRLDPDELEQQAPRYCYGRDQNVASQLETMLRLTALANELEVRRPQDWVNWARSYRLLPRWLAEYANIQRLSESTLSVPSNTMSQAGGLARHRKSKIGLAKEDILKKIDLWIETNQTETCKAFANRLLQDLEDEPDYQTKRKEIPEIDSVLKWIGQRRKASKA